MRRLAARFRRPEPPVSPSACHHCTWGGPVTGRLPTRPPHLTLARGASGVVPKSHEIGRCGAALAGAECRSGPAVWATGRSRTDTSERADSHADTAAIQNTGDDEINKIYVVSIVIVIGRH